MHLLIYSKRKITVHIFLAFINLTAPPQQVKIIFLFILLL